ncbi:hypothetical protein [Acinetobacter sp. ANC 4973]|uniref:hypothetical protein n=1 Tax=Acinetobacter sp. ANC 4973 TaxID=1977871 RepID=UPI000A347C54|nr:hypothetical protein [Acinetobacter sp. ANC 4973]OTG93659.1 hypothetical protein B9T30_15945 [Acinetobacter sp. ANC 4973]
MANNKQRSLRLLQPVKKRNNLLVWYGVSGFFIGAIFSLITGYIYLNSHEIQKPLAVINTHPSEQKFLEEHDDSVASILEKDPAQQEITHNDSSLKDENLEHTAEFPQPQNMDLNQAFSHHRDPKKMTSNLNNLKETVKEHQITAKNSADSKVVLKTETAKLTSANKALTAQDREKENLLLKENTIVVNETPQASVQITVTRTPIISKETAVSP